MALLLVVFVAGCGQEVVTVPCSPNEGDATVYGNFVRQRTTPRKKAEPVKAPSRNVDQRLERMMTELDKRATSEKRRIQRMFGLNRKGAA